MSRFLSVKYQNLVPYDTSGELAEGAKKYIRLNTNESPFPPSPRALERAAEAARTLQFYSDPDARALKEKLAPLLGVRPGEVLLGNGSDEILNFIFMAFCGPDRPAAFPDVTYSFYKVLAGVHGVPFREVPLEGDFHIDVAGWLGLRATLFLANPNSPTGLLLPLSDVERIVRGCPESLVVVDEAYIDFGGESCVPLIHRYENLLVTRTFSKSRSLAGARLGFCVGPEPLIRDLRAIKDSVGPYNVNAMTAAAGLGALEDEAYTQENCRAIRENRSFAAQEMRALGFELTESAGNFLFTRHPRMDGKELFTRLKERGILVRYYSAPRLARHNRVTVGTREQMEALLAALREILGGGLSR